MSAADHLNGQQFMSLAKVGALASRDHAWPVDSILHLLDQDKVSALTEDIRKHGVQKPLLVDGDMLREGHHRYAAAKAAGLRRVPFTRKFS